MYLELDSSVNLVKLKMLLEQHNYKITNSAVDVYSINYIPPDCLECAEKPTLIIQGKGVCIKHALENMDIVSNIRKGGF